VFSSSFVPRACFWRGFREDFSESFSSWGAGERAVVAVEPGGCGARCRKGCVGRGQSEPRGKNGRGARRRRCASPTAARVWYMELSVRMSITHDQPGAGADESVRGRARSQRAQETRTYEYSAGRGTCRRSLGEVRHLSGCAPSRGAAYPGPGQRAWRGRGEASGNVDELPGTWTSASLGYRIRGVGEGRDRHLVYFSSC
jgi:hypothetical protein